MFVELLIICPLVFLAGYVDAIAGGGGLISLPAYMIAGFQVHAAIATNKVSSSMGTTMSTYRYWHKGFVSFRKVLPIVVFSFCGSAIGAQLALLISDLWFKILMLIVLPPLAYYVTKEKDFDKLRMPYKKSKTFVLTALIAFVMGIYDGLYGPGTGTFLLLLLTGVAHLDLEHANGTSKAINLSTNYAAALVFIYNGRADITVGLIAGAFSIFGNFLGARRFERHGGRSVRLPMILVLAVLFIKIIWELCV
ncbi:MAG: sulfite exporter TauE/SafE family protein [Lachnospiraceae bacterium]|nr:sulfite exporter TauE/SafE family protein [Lachnospiraceae bacterium]